MKLTITHTADGRKPEHVMAVKVFVGDEEESVVCLKPGRSTTLTLRDDQFITIHKQETH